MSTIKGDPCTDMILDFIAGGVSANPAGESYGNYNAYFGHPKNTADLGVRTLNGIYEFQAAMLAQDPRSTAIGRYQFLKGTLDDLQKELGLSSSELFTPALQDKLAVRLLVRRGYSQWWRGEITDEAFAHGLSLEWASLPDPQNDGRSHYDGVAGNQAATTLAAVYAMLKQARAAIKDVTDPPKHDQAGTGDSAAPTVKALTEADPDASHPDDTDAIFHDIIASTVKTLQLSLRATGDYDGAIDGAWGKGSSAAITQFQQRTKA